MNSKPTNRDELRAEYDEAFWKAGVRGKYAERYAAGTNIVKLAPELMKFFPNEEAVNAALRNVVSGRSDTVAPSNEAIGETDDSSAEDVGQYFRDVDLISVE